MCSEEKFQTQVLKNEMANPYSKDNACRPNFTIKEPPVFLKYCLLSLCSIISLVFNFSDVEQLMIRVPFLLLIILFEVLISKRYKENRKIKSFIELIELTILLFTLNNELSRPIESILILMVTVLIQIQEKPFFILIAIIIVCNQAWHIILRDDFLEIFNGLMEIFAVFSIIKLKESKDTSQEDDEQDQSIHQESNIQEDSNAKILKSVEKQTEATVILPKRSNTGFSDMVMDNIENLAFRSIHSSSPSRKSRL